MKFTSRKHGDCTPDAGPGRREFTTVRRPRKCVHVATHVVTVRHGRKVVYRENACWNCTKDVARTWSDGGQVTITALGG